MGMTERKDLRSLLLAAEKKEWAERVAAWHRAPDPKPPIPCCRFIVGCPSYCDWPQVYWCAIEREGLHP